jgi:outer membrane protein TolC
MKSHIAVCLVLASLVPASASAQSVRSSGERLSLDGAIRLAIENNRQLQTARLQVQKAEADVAAARTRRLPIFETEVTTSQLMTPVSFAFPQGAFDHARDRARARPRAAALHRQ